MILAALKCKVTNDHKLNSHMLFPQFEYIGNILVMYDIMSFEN